MQCKVTVNVKGHLHGSFPGGKKYTLAVCSSSRKEKCLLVTGRTTEEVQWMEHRNVISILHITETSQERPLVLAKLLPVGKLGICLALLKEIVRSDVYS